MDQATNGPEQHRLERRLQPPCSVAGRPARSVARCPATLAVCSATWRSAVTVRRPVRPDGGTGRGDRCRGAAARSAWPWKRRGSSRVQLWVLASLRRSMPPTVGTSDRSAHLGTLRDGAPHGEPRAARRCTRARRGGSDTSSRSVGDVNGPIGLGDLLEDRTEQIVEHDLAIEAATRSCTADRVSRSPARPDPGTAPAVPRSDAASSAALM